MDITCPKCGEPWEVDAFHDVLADMPNPPRWRPDSSIPGEYDRAWSALRRDFFRRGCGAAFQAAGWSSGKCSGADPATAAFVGMLADVLGDDIDGIASELEDARALGYLQ